MNETIPWHKPANDEAELFPTNPENICLIMLWFIPLLPLTPLGSVDCHRAGLEPLHTADRIILLLQLVLRYCCGSEIVGISFKPKDLSPSGHIYRTVVVLYTHCAKHSSGEKVKSKWALASAGEKLETSRCKLTKYQSNNLHPLFSIRAFHRLNTKTKCWYFLTVVFLVHKQKIKS